MNTLNNIKYLTTRVGAGSLLTVHPTCKLEDFIFRGGWEAKGFSRAFCYIGGILGPISTAGRALSGWKDSRMFVHQPDCTTIPAEFMIKVDNLIVKLFQSSVSGMDPRGRLWPLAKCIFASYLVNLSTIRVKYPNHPTLPILREKCDECDIRFSLLLEWGVQISKKFQSDNMRAVVQEGGSLIPLLLERVVVLEECVTSQKEVRTLNKAILLFYSTHGMILLHQPTSAIELRCDADNDGVHARED